MGARRQQTFPCIAGTLPGGVSKTSSCGGVSLQCVAALLAHFIHL